MTDIGFNVVVSYIMVLKLVSSGLARSVLNRGCGVRNFIRSQKV